MIFVIGSGPAGVSCAVALINKGHEVTMLDTGFELEPERMAVVKHMQSLNKTDWDSESVNSIKKGMRVHTHGVDFKYIYGSDFPYRGMDLYQPLELKKTKMVRSLAKGGLSNVWGASILPFREIDIKDWPINIKSLEPHYHAVRSFMPLAGHKDDLESIFSPIGDCTEFDLCNQSLAFFKELKLNKKYLEDEKFLLGHSRLAVNFKSTNQKQGCQYCGLCLYGCPYSLIYSTTQTLEQLSEHKSFNYINGILVEKLVETNGKVKVIGKTIKDFEKIEFIGSQVFLAAGTVSSTRILIHSLEAFSRPFTFKHSDHFQIPLLRYKSVKNVLDEELHTLTQLYIELLDKSICENTIHMQVYAFNDLFYQLFSKFLGPLTRGLKPQIETILGRILLIKGYLHSRYSSQIKAYLEPGNNGAFVLTGIPNEKAQLLFIKIKKKLLKNKKYFKAIPLPLLSKLDLPGVGNHSGGTFPMKKSPAEFESDEFGRPYSFEKVHVVDSTIFPSIPATTISFSIMANAHRIASEYDS